MSGNRKNVRRMQRLCDRSQDAAGVRRIRLAGEHGLADDGRGKDQGSDGTRGLPVKVDLTVEEIADLIAAVEHYIAYLKVRERDQRPHEALLAKLRKARGTRK